MALTIYFVRHAEAANPRDILYGRLPRVDLSSRGREQAATVARAMADLPLEAIYQSPLLRARRTAAAISRYHPDVPIHTSSLLLENRHPYEGRAQSEVAKLGNRAYDPDVLGDTGESIADVRDRLLKFLRRAARRHSHAVLAAVAHADPLAALRLHLLGKELGLAGMRQEAPPLASIFRVDLTDDGTARLEWFWKPEPPTAAPAAPSGNGSRGLDGPAVTPASAAAESIARIS